MVLQTRRSPAHRLTELSKCNILTSLTSIRRSDSTKCGFDWKKNRPVYCRSVYVFFYFIYLLFISIYSFCSTHCRQRRNVISTKFRATKYRVGAGREEGGRGPFDVLLGLYMQPYSSVEALLSCGMKDKKVRGSLLGSTQSRKWSIIWENKSKRKKKKERQKERQKDRKRV